MRITHGGFVRRPAAFGVLSLLALAAVGCASRGASQAGRTLPARASRPALVFENAGIEPVKLYLAERGHEWFVGYVSPGKTEVLPLPAAVGATPISRQFALVVVPSTESRFTRRASGALPGIITSESFTRDYLTSMRWKVVGRWVVAMPDPIWP
jgi:hypothetical protein